MANNTTNAEINVKSWNMNGANCLGDKKARSALNQIMQVAAGDQCVMMALQEVPIDDVVRVLRGDKKLKNIDVIDFEEYVGLRIDGRIAAIGTRIVGLATNEIGRRYLRQERHGAVLVWSRHFEFIDVLMPEYYLEYGFGRRSTLWARLKIGGNEIYAMSIHASVSRAAQLLPHILREIELMNESGNRAAIVIGDFNLSPDGIKMAAGIVAPPQFEEENGGNNDVDTIEILSKVYFHVFPHFTHVDAATGKPWEIDGIITGKENKIGEKKIFGINVERVKCTMAGHDHGQLSSMWLI